VVSIAELDFSNTDALQRQPRVKVVEHYWWTGKKHTELYAQLVDLLKNVWRCRKVVVDATGVGQPVASFLKPALGSVVIPFVFTQPSKSELGFNLLAAVNSGRLKMYRADGSAEYQEFWWEMEWAKSHYRPSQTMNFYVDPALRPGSGQALRPSSGQALRPSSGQALRPGSGQAPGHDDFLMSLALVVEAASQYSPRGARGSEGIL
jgi:hypothetical protein